MSRSRRLLLVTGDKSEAAYVQASLAAGLFVHDITHATDLHEAAKALLTRGFDAILVDIGITGSQPTKAVRRLAALAPDAAILVITDNANVPAAVEAVQEGAQDYILWSSFNGGALAHRLQFCIDRFERERDTQHRLRESERCAQRFESLVHDNADAMLVLNANGRIKFANPAAARMFGRDPVSLIGTDPGIPVEDGDTLEVVLHHPDEAVVEIRITRTFWGDEAVMLASLRDISQRKRAERALMRAKQEAELASETKSKFLAHMSHELRTPLNSIIGFTELMQKGIFGTVENARYVDYLETIQYSGTHLLTLINNLLDLSKIEAGREELHEENVDMPTLLRTAAHAEDATARKHGLTLLCDIDRQPRMLRADPVKLNQVVLNLLSNAIKFTGDGGRIVLQGRGAENGGYEITVTDTGCGMDPDDIPEALGAFAQIRSPYVRKGERGTGLGLPIARSLAELHQGSLEISSRRGVGTKVTVLLPPERVIRNATRKHVPVARDGRARYGS